MFFAEAWIAGFDQAKKKISVFTVRRPTLILAPTVNFFYGTFSRKLFKYPSFAFKCSFFMSKGIIILIKNKVNITLQV